MKLVVDLILLPWWVRDEEEGGGRGGGLLHLGVGGGGRNGENGLRGRFGGERGLGKLSVF